jgi:serine phosphatase RsbU (regulator of sigma subunit)
MALFGKRPGAEAPPSGGREDTDGALAHVPLAGSTVGFGGTMPGRMVAAGADARAHFLLVVEGDNPGLRVRLGPEPVVIGRAPPADVVLPDQKVSRNHCRVGIVDGEAVVTDLGSTNGTFIDLNRVSGSARLPTGARLHIGGHVLVHEWRLRKEVEQSEELDRDIAGASRYVLALLPPPLTAGPIRTEWNLLPSARVGGDAFGYRFVDERTFAIYLIDVSGHGASAALHAVSVINVLRQHALPRTDFRKPAQVMAKLNAMFQMESHGGMYVSAWYGVYDLETRRLAYCSAGHHPGFLVPAARDGAIPLRTKNLVIGATPEYAFKAGVADVPPGSMLYVFSDGAFEITTKTGEQWGVNDLVPLILGPAVPGTLEPQRLLDAVQGHSRTAALDDDFSMLVVTFS